MDKVKKVRNREIRISDLALELGLTKGTISRALNGYEDISKKTRLRVIEAANKYGYVPSTPARRLALGLSETIGIVLPKISSQPVNTFVSEFINSISSNLNKYGYDLLVHTNESDAFEVEPYQRLVKSRKVDGFIIFRTLKKDKRVDYLLSENFPFVTYGRTARIMEHDWFDIDGEKAFEEATSHLIKMGHKRISFIGGGKEFFSAQFRIQGFRKMIGKSNLEKKHCVEMPGDLSGKGGEIAAHKLLEQKFPPTAILCSNDATALGVIKIAKEIGFRIPEDLSVLGYDGIALRGYMDPPLSTLSFSIEEGGREGVDLLINRLKEPKKPFKSKIAFANLQLRGSDGENS